VPEALGILNRKKIWGDAGMALQAATTADEVGTLGDAVRFHASDNPDKQAMLFDGRSTSYREFDQHTNRVANGLLAAGLSHQARIAFLGKDSDYFYQVVLGCAKSAAVIVGVNWRLAAPEVAYILNDCLAEVLFVGPYFHAVAESIKDRVPSLKLIISMGEHAEWPAFVDWRDAQSDSDPAISVATDDVAVQMYTSGTTGRPKGVQLMHRCFFDIWRQPPNADMKFNAADKNGVYLVALPGFHAAGLAWGLRGLREGARTVIMREFDADETLALIQQQGITQLVLVPAAIRMLVQHPKARETDFSSVQFVRYGASPIPLDLLREALEVFRCGFVQLYGMTETGGSATYLPPDDHDPAGNERMRSAGKALPGVRVKVIDPDGREVPPRQSGEICVSSPSNMKGYWNLPEETASTMLDGFVHTGDAGFLDEDGYLYVQDRIKDMIVSGGENIYPAEVESALFGHPAVADVAVIGVPDDRWGEAAKALIVLRPDAIASADEIIAFARQRIASYKLPKTVDFVAELPRNASGKILKRELRKPFWERMDRGVN
jgi:acyl-CoA synthetase (AMP-forming)/AMP-acid ligase II